VHKRQSRLITILDSIRSSQTLIRSTSLYSLLCLRGLELENTLHNLLLFHQERADDAFAHGAGAQNPTVRPRHGLLVLGHVLSAILLRRNTRNPVDASSVAGRSLRPLRGLLDVLDAKTTTRESQLADLVRSRRVGVSVSRKKRGIAVSRAPWRRGSHGARNRRRRGDATSRAHRMRYERYVPLTYRRL